MENSVHYVETFAQRVFTRKQRWLLVFPRFFFRVATHAVDLVVQNELKF